jgi:hypothetical protein
MLNEKQTTAKQWVGILLSGWGDKTPFEFSIAGVRCWEAGLRLLMGDGKLDKCRSCVRSNEFEEQDLANHGEVRSL